MEEFGQNEEIRKHQKLRNIKYVWDSIPLHFWPRSIKKDKRNKRVTIYYGTPRINEEEIKEFQEKILLDTGWNLIFKQKIDYRSVIERIKYRLPKTLLTTKVSYYEKEKQIVIRCTGSKEQRQTLEKLVSKFSEGPIDVKFELTETNLTEILKEQPKITKPKRYGEFISFSDNKRVGGSCHYLELSNLKILLDCGADFQTDSPPKIPDEIIKNLDYILLSHAHTDHSGLIPWLYTEGCNAQLICTEPTLKISELLMKEHIRIQKTLKHQKPLYTKNDIQFALRHIKIIKLDQEYQIGNNASITFLNSGHILGGSMILIKDKEQKILYTGDFYSKDTKTMQGAKIPDKLNHIIIETTYGGRTHLTRIETEQTFLNALEQTLNENGTVLIPTAAVGRAQEILTVLKNHPKIGKNKTYPIYVAGSIKKINKIYNTYLNSSYQVYLNSELSNILSEKTSNFRDVQNRGEIIYNKTPKVIITTSGMCEGLASYFLSYLIEDPKNLLMFVSYQADETTGRTLLDGANQIELDDETHQVNIQIAQTNFSAHADQYQLIDAIIKQNQLHTIIPVHGNKINKDSFVYELEQFGTKDYKIIIPEVNKTIRLY